MNPPQTTAAVDLASVSAYQYDLPEELIAQDPVEPRDSSRLLVLERGRGVAAHRTFRDLEEYLREGDLLVLNDTRVRPARLRARKTSSGRVEILVLRPLDPASNLWTALVRPGRRVPPGTPLLLEDGTEVRVEERLEDGLRALRLPQETDATRLFRRLGEVPLPPYITRSVAPAERYQTVYSRPDREGSAAAPTAGLHFTAPLLKRLEARGIGQAFVTLDVGLGTFRPVQTERAEDHVMHLERCSLGEETAEAIRQTRRRGGRVVAVGTTVVRTLETFANEEGQVLPGERDTRLYIRPGYRFRVVDGLISNFHLPRSTLLMLVAAFGGYEPVLEAYREAVQLRYRFFSFGDAMILL